MTRESRFQHELIVELYDLFPDCIILKNDPNYIQGIPDIIILYNRHWGVLETKKDLNSKYRPNQKYYLDRMNEMSFARRISPENKEEVLNELQQAFGTKRVARLSKR